MQSFECSNQRQLSGQMASLASLDSLKRSDGAWDSILRSVCRGGFFWEDIIPPKNRPVPLHICSSHSQDFESSEEVHLQRRINRILNLSHQANIAVMIADEETSSTIFPVSVISQWTLFQVFASDAMKDVQSLFDSQLFFPSSKDTSISNLFQRALTEDQPELPGLVNILLHLMHASGNFY